MPLTGRVKGIAVALAAGTVIAAATGVGYAAGSTSSASVKACANAKGRLALLSSTGKCPKTYKAVTLNKQGPRGATGAKGATGARGPGSRVLAYSVSASGTGPTLTVAGYRYRATCTIGSGSATTQLVITPPAGVSAALNTLVTRQVNDAGPLTTQSVRTGMKSTPTSVYSSASTGDINRYYADAMRVTGSNGSVQVVTLDIAAFAGSTPSTGGCKVQAVIIPAS